MTTICLVDNKLIHWGIDNMAAILQTAFSNVISRMKIFEFWLKCLKFVDVDQIDNFSSLVEIMAWRRTGDKPLSETVISIYTSPGFNKAPTTTITLNHPGPAIYIIVLLCAKQFTCYRWLMTAEVVKPYTNGCNRRPLISVHINLNDLPLHFVHLCYILQITRINFRKLSRMNNDSVCNNDNSNGCKWKNTDDYIYNDNDNININTNLITTAPVSRG